LYGINFLLFQFAARLYRMKESKYAGISLLLIIIAWSGGIATGFALEVLCGKHYASHVMYVVGFFSSPIIALALIIFCNSLFLIH